MLVFTDADIDCFALSLAEREYSAATVSQYARCARLLMDFSPGGVADRAALAGFRDYLAARGYAPASVNAVLGAVNRFLSFLGSDWRLKYQRVQCKTFLPADRELTHREYERMVRAAEQSGDERLALLIQTLCALGLRVSELGAITVESLRRGEAAIQNKGKLRAILIPHALAKKLKAYCERRGVTSGSVFVTRTGKPLDRSNVWKMLKKLAEVAKVAAKKVFPHNLRRLFARTHYDRFRDLARLADILGHSSVDTTRIYTRRSGQEERRQLGQLRLIL
ncbi:MAG: integrase [Ruminococcaceae bacterium]|nr:integrase [Oscillospiraceae bacterium]